MKVNIKKAFSDSLLPTKGHKEDAGWDLYAHSKYKDHEGNIVYDTGIQIEIPKGYVGLVFPRSSIASVRLTLTNSVGVIDSNYRGNIMAKFKPTLVNETSFTEILSEYREGDRIAQLIIIPYPEIEFEEVQELSASDRGNKGYGSTGR